MEIGYYPVKINALKHHLAYLSGRLTVWINLEWERVREELQELGDNQFDIYTGQLSVEEIITFMGRYLFLQSIHTREELHSWLGERGYKTIYLPDDSKWVVRESETGERFAHIHPARNQLLSKRVRASHVKTALALIYGSRGTPAPETGLTTAEINRIRIGRLDLSPVKSLNDSRKILETLIFITGGCCE